MRIAVVDDHTIVRQGLRALLEAEPDFEVVAEAADAPEALQLLPEARPDVVVTDFMLPGLDGAALIERLRLALPEVKVVVLSMYSDEAFVRAAFRAGASGYLLKGRGVADLVRAVRCARAGEIFVDPAVAAALVDKAVGPTGEAGAADSLARLSPREREVLKLAAEGCTTREIAAQLSISPKTVEGHRSRLMAKLGLEDLQGLVRYAVRKKLVPPD